MAQVQFQRVTYAWEQGQYKEAFSNLLTYLFTVDSIASVFVRAALWGIVATIVLVSMDMFRKHLDETTMVKINLGFFFLFLILGGGLTYLLFGFSPQL